MPYVVGEIKFSFLTLLDLWMDVRCWSIIYGEKEKHFLAPAAQFLISALMTYWLVQKIVVKKESLSRLTFLSKAQWAKKGKLLKVVMFAVKVFLVIHWKKGAAAKNSATKIVLGIAINNFTLYSFVLYPIYNYMLCIMYSHCTFKSFYDFQNMFNLIKILNLN